MIRLMMKNFNRILTEKKPKCQLYYQVRLINMNLLPADQCRIIEQAKLTYSPLVKVKTETNKGSWRAWKTTN